MVGSVSSTSTSAYTTAGTTSATQRHKDMFAKLDANGDGKVDTLELSAVTSKNSKGPDAAALMKQIDTNGDGSISETENDTFLTVMENPMKGNAKGAMGAAAGGRPPGPPPGGAPGGASSTAASTTKVFDKFDTNQDGKVSMEELMAGLAKEEASKSTTSKTKERSISESDAKELFKKIDANGDASIDKTELDSFTKKMEDAIKNQEHTASTYTQQGTVNYDAVGSTVNTIA
jgi:Ca2+-binding EF-hand superfamily protein